METPRQLIILWAVCVIAWNPVARCSDEPSPRPTPRPGTLAALAAERTLTRTGDSPSIVITDENLASLGAGAAFTRVESPVAEFIEVAAPEGVDPKTRDHWRNKVLAQSEAIARLETKKSAIEDQIDRLERGRLDARALDRIEKAEAKLRAAEAEIERAKQKLSRIVREARKDGAQPGWFR
jgi:exonuclease VII small subunit